MHPPFTPLIEKLCATVPFVGPDAMERQTGRQFRVRIGANENVFGPSPKAIAAMREAAADAWKYGDAEIHDLKQALAGHHGLRSGNIAVGEGIDGLFGLAVRLFAEPGVTVATSLGAYPTFNYHVHGFGGRLVTTPYVNDCEDPGALLDLARKEKARLIYFSNPDNPMGSWWSAADVARMIAGLPPHALLMLDEAYGEFAPEGTLPPFDVENRQVLRFRTFSKAYGMAGLRLGYAIGHRDVIKAFDKIRNHFGVTGLGQHAAIAALGDQEHLNCVIEKVAAARQEIARIATANGLRPLRSASNFVSIDCGRDGDYAKRVLNGLLARGVFVRMPGVAPLNRCIRVTVGRGTDLEIFAQELPAAINAAG